MPDLIDQEEGRSLFGSDLQNYQDIRPQYPEQIYRFLVSSGALYAGVPALEIGSGNGLATGRLLELGADPMTLVEPDRRFSHSLVCLSEPYGAEVTLIEESFEDAELPRSHYGLVAAATSFHWIQASVGLTKIAKILRPGGYAALWWNVFGDPDRNDPFHDSTQMIMQRLSSSPSGRPDAIPFALDADARLHDFSKIGKFDTPECEFHRWTLTLNTEQVGSLYSTFSSISRLPEYERKSILDRLMMIAEREFGGVVKRNMVSSVYLAKRGPMAD